MQEITMSLDGGAREPLYEQIYRYLKNEIQRRQILPSERLPSTRALAAHLQVSRSTVDLAYGQLMAEGYIESAPYRGYYVCELEGIYQSDGYETEEKPEETTVRDYAIDFAVNGIDSQGFPHDKWRKLSKEILLTGDSLMGLGDAKGDREFRSVLKSYLHHARGVHCSSRQIIVGAGNDYLLMLLRVILGDDHVIAMENPTYKSAWQAFDSLGYQVRAVGMDESGMRVDELRRSGADIAYVMPSHQFPVGTVMPLKRRSQLLSWAAEKEGRYIIEDDYDSEFRYRGKPIPALQGYDSRDKVVYLGTFSKSIAPAIRVSYMVLPKSLLRAYEERGRIFSATVSRVDQKILELFISRGEYERHLNRMRTIYKAKHDLLLSLLKGMNDICRVSGEHAGVHVVLHLVNGLSEQEAVERAAESGIKVYGISEYDTRENIVQQQLPATVILGYAPLSEREIREGVAGLQKAWRI